VPIKFSKEELYNLRKLLRQQQEAIEMLKLLSIVNKTCERLEYPITSSSDFVKKLGKEKGSATKFSKEEVSIVNEIVKVDYLKRILHRYLFPISGPQDIQDKTNKLYNKK
jgi:hypothetical protein